MDDICRLIESAEPMRRKIRNDEWRDSYIQDLLADNTRLAYDAIRWEARCWKARGWLMVAVAAWVAYGVYLWAL